MGLGLLDDECLAGVGLSVIDSTKANESGRDNGVPSSDGKEAAPPAHHGESVPRRTKILNDFGDYELFEEIAHTVLAAGDIEDELRHLVAVLRA